MNCSVKEIFTKDNIPNWETLWFVLGDFLDDFKRNPSYSRLEEEPEFIEERISAFLSAVVDKLAGDYQLPIPQWIFKKIYHLDRPFFVGGFKGDYNIFLLRESPTEFRCKNIFVAENILDRC